MAKVSSPQDGSLGAAPLPVDEERGAPLLLEATLRENAAKVKASFVVPSCAVQVGAMVLAAFAGMVNAVGFLTTGVFLTHVTGTLTKAGFTGTEHIDKDGAEMMIGLMAAFTAGSFLCGLLIPRNPVYTGADLYGVVFFGISALLLIAMYYIDAGQDRGTYFAAAACGLQNAACTTYSGQFIRTTHATGLTTDLGLFSGRVVGRILKRVVLRQQLDLVDQTEIQVELVKLKILTMIGFGFVVGVVAGTYAYGLMHVKAFLIPAGICGLAGVAYTSHRVLVLRMGCCSRSGYARELSNDTPVTGAPATELPARNSGKVDDDGSPSRLQDIRSQGA